MDWVGNITSSNVLDCRIRICCRGNVYRTVATCPDKTIRNLSESHIQKTGFQDSLETFINNIYGRRWSHIHTDPLFHYNHPKLGPGSITAALNSHAIKGNVDVNVNKSSLLLKGEILVTCRYLWQRETGNNFTAWVQRISTRHQLQTCLALGLRMKKVGHKHSLDTQNNIT
jgi:hypothetical protein